MFNSDRMKDTRFTKFMEKASDMKFMKNSFIEKNSFTYLWKCDVWQIFLVFFSGKLISIHYEKFCRKLL